MAKCEERKRSPNVLKFSPENCVFYRTEIHGTETVKRCIVFFFTWLLLIHNTRLINMWNQRPTPGVKYVETSERRYTWKTTNTLYRLVANENLEIQTTVFNGQPLRSDQNTSPIQADPCFGCLQNCRWEIQELAANSLTKSSFTGSFTCLFTESMLFPTKMHLLKYFNKLAVKTI